MSRLEAQRALVAARARNVQQARLASTAARRWLAYAVRRKIASPAVLLGAFAAGFAVGARRAARQTEQPAKRAGRVQLQRLLLTAASWFARRAVQLP